jgi:hypothetical protein
MTGVASSLPWLLMIGAVICAGLLVAWKEARTAGLIIAQFFLTIGLPVVVIIGAAVWVALPFLGQLATGIQQAMIAGLVIAVGWLTAAIFAELAKSRGRAERLRDYHKAIYAEIGNTLESLWVAGETDAYVTSLFERMAQDRTYVPFIPREHHDHVYDAVISEIDVLPRQTIDAIVAYYSLIKSVAALADDMRGATFKTLDVDRDVFRLCRDAETGLPVRKTCLEIDQGLFRWRGHCGPADHQYPGRGPVRHVTGIGVNGMLGSFSISDLQVCCPSNIGQHRPAFKDHPGAAVSFCSRISRWRIGILSMLRLISRTSHGKGLRNSITPSLPTSTSINPRGRILSLSAAPSLGFVSVNTTTSRSRNSSGRASSSSSCSINAGSSRLSAKTTTGRFFHRNSLKSAISAGRNSISCGAVSSVCAASEVAKNPAITSGIMGFIKAPVLTDIGGLALIAMQNPSDLRIKDNSRALRT